MSRQTKRELLEENDELRTKLEEIHSQIGGVLGFDEEDDDDAEEDEELDDGEEEDEEG